MEHLNKKYFLWPRENKECLSFVRIGELSVGTDTCFGFLGFCFGFSRDFFGCLGECLSFVRIGELSVGTDAWLSG